MSFTWLLPLLLFLLVLMKNRILGYVDSHNIISKKITIHRIQFCVLLLLYLIMGTTFNHTNAGRTIATDICYVLGTAVLLIDTRRQVIDYNATIHDQLGQH